MLVAKVAVFLANKLDQLDTFDKLDKKLLVAGALLHDIDKNVKKLPGERHPDAGVRILKEEWMEEVAALVATHSLHTILAGSDMIQHRGQAFQKGQTPSIAPKTWEEKLLFLADKMVKDDIIGVDARFKLWNEEYLPADEQAILDAAYPKVKELEQEICNMFGLKPEQLVKEIKKEYTNN